MFPAETESSQMDFGNFLSAESCGAGLCFLWGMDPREGVPFVLPHSLLPPQWAPSHSPASPVGGDSVTSQGYHQQLWLLAVFLHPGLIFPLVSI